MLPWRSKGAGDTCQKSFFLGKTCVFFSWSGDNAHFISPFATWPSRTLSEGFTCVRCRGLMLEKAIVCLGVFYTSQQARKREALKSLVNK